MNWAKQLLFVASLSVLGLLISAVALYQLMNSETFQVAGEIIPRVKTDQKLVALTFDDGPNEQVGPILGVLKEKQVTGTFYVIGDNIEKNRAAAQQLVAAGHELGNHSYTHQRMIFKSNAFVAEEIEKTDALIRAAGYQGEITFRPPFGKKLFALPHYLARHHRKTITWDVEPQKFLGAQATTPEIVAYVRQQTKPGSIILLHPWYGEQNSSRDAIADIIDQLKADGYRFVTVRELLSEAK